MSTHDLNWHVIWCQRQVPTDWLRLLPFLVSVMTIYIHEPVQCMIYWCLKQAHIYQEDLLWDCDISNALAMESCYSLEMAICVAYGCHMQTYISSWLVAGRQYLQCFSNGDVAVLCRTIHMVYKQWPGAWLAPGHCLYLWWPYVLPSY